jgi:hypothetical protein
MHESNHSDLKSFINNKLTNNGKQIKAKHSPISEFVDNVPQSLRIEKIYDLSTKEKYTFLFIVRNYDKKPKLRYFLAISLANNSSDLLVQFARDYAIKSNLKLIQYSIYPKTLRIQLLMLKELKTMEDYTNSIEKLKIYRKQFRSKLVKIKNIVENE